MPIKVVIKKSTTSGKKYTAIFYENDKKIKTTHFGATGYSDYTLSKDKEQRDRYRNRHKKDLRTGDYKRAGFLSYYILWGNSTSIRENIKLYKSRFNLI
tara:strand:+ start:379 stop:675 length:297 start_codon:yes stop_codon:yes gene_type:complete